MVQVRARDAKHLEDALERIRAHAGVTGRRPRSSSRRCSSGRSTRHEGPRPHPAARRADGPVAGLGRRSRRRARRASTTTASGGATFARPSTPARTSTPRPLRRRAAQRSATSRPTSSSAPRSGSTPARCATATRAGARGGRRRGVGGRARPDPGRRGRAALHRLGRLPRGRRPLRRGAARVPGLRRRRRALLVERGVAGSGSTRWASTRVQHVDYPVHNITLPAGLWHLEGLIGLDAVPADGRDARRRRPPAARRVRDAGAGVRALP